MRAVPAIEKYADITTEQLAQVGSASLTIDTIIEVARATRRATDEGAVGVVVTQGTDSLEETAFVLAMLHQSSQPVVITGAMRDPTLPGADGPANLLAAVQVATSEAARDFGAVVVFNDELHDPVFVRKSHTSNPATFTSGPAAGPLGWISEGDVVLPHRPVRRVSLPVPSGRIAPVALLPATLGDELRLLDFVRECGYVAVVIDGMGGGHVPQTAVDASRKRDRARKARRTRRRRTRRTQSPARAVPAAERRLHDPHRPTLARVGRRALTVAGGGRSIGAPPQDAHHRRHRRWWCADAAYGQRRGPWSPAPPPTCVSRALTPPSG